MGHDPIVPFEPVYTGLAGSAALGAAGRAVSRRGAAESPPAPASRLCWTEHPVTRLRPV